MSIQIQNITYNKPWIDTKLKEIEDYFFSYRDFYETVQSAVFWLNQTYKFRAQIVEKYVRLAYIESIKMANATGLNIDQADLFRDLIISIHKAIDKYDSSKGPLTSYVNIWFREKKTDFKAGHEYGVAYQLSSSKRKSLLEDGSFSNFTVELNNDVAESIEDLSQDALASIIDKEDGEIMANIACRADRHKIYCLTNDLTYTLTPEDKALLAKTLETA